MIPTIKFPDDDVFILFSLFVEVISIVSTNESKIFTPVVSPGGMNFSPKEEGSSAQLDVKKESTAIDKTENRKRKYFLFFTYEP